MSTAVAPASEAPSFTDFVRRASGPLWAATRQERRHPGGGPCTGPYAPLEPRGRDTTVPHPCPDACVDHFQTLICSLYQRACRRLGAGQDSDPWADLAGLRRSPTRRRNAVEEARRRERVGLGLHARLGRTVLETAAFVAALPDLADRELLLDAAWFAIGSDPAEATVWPLERWSRRPSEVGGEAPSPDELRMRLERALAICRAARSAVVRRFIATHIDGPLAARAAGLPLDEAEAGEPCTGVRDPGPGPEELAWLGMLRARARRSLQAGANLVEVAVQVATEIGGPAAVAQVQNRPASARRLVEELLEAAAPRASPPSML